MRTLEHTTSKARPPEPTDQGTHSPTGGHTHRPGTTSPDS
ncbi:hypothetical protein BN2537_959 [Streptomyces venezuelae]|nr:hypothetical protein BN2537_959 [Streptomyces venezuelae]